MRQHERERQASGPSAPLRWSGPHRRNNWITSSASPDLSTGSSASSFSSRSRPRSPGAWSGAFRRARPAEGILISGGGRVVDAVSGGAGPPCLDRGCGRRPRLAGSGDRPDCADRHRAAPSQRGRSLSRARARARRSQIEDRARARLEGQELRQARGGVRPDRSGDGSAHRVPDRRREESRGSADEGLHDAPQRRGPPSRA